MSSHIIVPPKGDRTPAQPATKEEAEAVGIPTSGEAPISKEKVERIPVPKGTRVLIGGKNFVAQSDAGVTVRSFEHNHGAPTKVTIIDAPTEEAVAFAQGLVDTGQMRSEDEVRALRKKLKLNPGEYLPNDAVQPRVRRDRLSQAHKAAELVAHQRKMAERADALKARLRAAGIEPEEISTEDALAKGRIRALEEQVAKAGIAEEEEETVKLGAK
jgi:hypothetical protein